MTLVTIRHGEPDYAPSESRGYMGHGMDLAPLTDAGRAQAEEAAKDSRLNGAEFIVTSPYTRALQTAAIIARRRDLDIRVEMDLHEWMPDLTFQYRTKEELRALDEDFLRNKGAYPQGETRRWETVEMHKNRVAGVLERYSGFRKIIVVAHGLTIARITGRTTTHYCGVTELEYRAGHRFYGWVE